MRNYIIFEINDRIEVRLSIFQCDPLLFTPDPKCIALGFEKMYGVYIYV